jgi:catechol 2,3-dioxygenase-like lactoylglutathione lyase family enzyme
VFDHVTIRVSDREASGRFYDTVLDVLGQARSHSGPEWDEWNDFSLGAADSENPVTRGLHVGFVARSRHEVDDFWRAGIEAGYESDGEPGLRPEYHEDYYGGFLLDPDGNSAEAVYHGRLREGTNTVDHVWIRVADLDASKAFYETVAPPLGLGTRDRGHRFQVEARDRSFALVPGDRPTANVHLAFPLPADAGVDEFHLVALAAGYRDHGPPGERDYHPGYYAAFVLDPDGNNIEAVNHNRG